jgi:hypothetical protein
MKTRIEFFNEYLDWFIGQSALKYTATVIDDVVYFNRASFRFNGLLKDGEKCPGLSSPDKQIHNLGFWYGWKDMKIPSFDQWLLNNN